MLLFFGLQRPSTHNYSVSYWTSRSKYFPDHIFAEYFLWKLLHYFFSFSTTNSTRQIHPNNNSIPWSSKQMVKPKQIIWRPLLSTVQSSDVDSYSKGWDTEGDTGSNSADKILRTPRLGPLISYPWKLKQFSWNT